MHPAGPENGSRQDRIYTRPGLMSVRDGIVPQASQRGVRISEALFQLESDMDFSELVELELREAWPDEAGDFTPWLEDNLQRLSRVIGIAIEPDDSQVWVDGFTADVLASFPVNGSRVVIENQLDNTDHAHLGQILSNMARLEAQTAIWLAREFQPAHLSAIRWLNINTPGDFNFFAVRVRAVRIGEFPSPIAPIFDVWRNPMTGTGGWWR